MIRVVATLSLLTLVYILASFFSPLHGLAFADPGGKQIRFPAPGDWIGTPTLIPEEKQACKTDDDCGADSCYSYYSQCSTVVVITARACMGGRCVTEHYQDTGFSSCDDSRHLITFGCFQEIDELTGRLMWEPDNRIDCGKPINDDFPSCQTAVVGVCPTAGCVGVM